MQGLAKVLAWALENVERTKYIKKISKILKCLKITSEYNTVAKAKLTFSISFIIMFFIIKDFLYCNISHMDGAW